LVRKAAIDEKLSHFHEIPLQAISFGISMYEGFLTKTSLLDQLNSG
jgi:hypothetical protein